MKKDLLFLDANVLFSAAYRDDSGLSKFWKLHTVELVSSVYAIEEAMRNLDQHTQKTRLEKLLVDVEKILYVPDSIQLSDNVSIREKDRPILQAAISVNADYLITGDIRDFGKYFGKKINGVLIISPATYLNNTY